MIYYLFFIDTALLFITPVIRICKVSEFCVLFSHMQFIPQIKFTSHYWLETCLSNVDYCLVSKHPSKHFYHVIKFVPQNLENNIYLFTMQIIADPSLIQCALITILISIHFHQDHAYMHLHILFSVDFQGMRKAHI
jgi:hypothetical protein